MLPLHLASGDGGVHSTTDRGQEPAPNPGPEPHAQHDGPAPVATGSTDATERHARTRITQSDWNIHRETIVYLYRDRMQPLNQVRETMEREYGFFATERMYKHRFKQWRMFKYAKPGGTGKPPRAQDDKATPPRPAHAVARRPRNVRPAGPLAMPDSLRGLEACLNHLHSFILATCGDAKKRPRTVDPSPEMALDRSSWCFSVNNAVLQIHQGRLATGFRLLDAAFGEFRRGINAQDTGFPLRLVTSLCLFADPGLPGLVAIFLQYAYHTLCLELSPTHPFSIVTRHIQATTSRDGFMDAAWDLVGRYSELLWASSDAGAAAPAAGPFPGLTELSWDLSRSVERDFIAPLAAPSQTLGWAPGGFAVAMSVAQLQLTQRLYGGARRAVAHLLARLDPAAAPLDVALARRTAWQISRAEGRRARAAADARAYVGFCRAALGPAHYMTARAVQDYDDYLREGRAAGPPDAAAEAAVLADSATLPREPEE